MFFIYFKNIFLRKHKKILKNCIKRKHLEFFCKNKIIKFFLEIQNFRIMEKEIKKKKELKKIFYKKILNINVKKI